MESLTQSRLNMWVNHVGYHSLISARQTCRLICIGVFMGVTIVATIQQPATNSKNAKDGKNNIDQYFWRHIVTPLA